MPGLRFFYGVERMDQWLGNLFSRGQPLESLERSYFHSLSFFNGWHSVMAEAERPKEG